MKSKIKVQTLVYLNEKANNKILLGMKKRGFGAGKWNGFGGNIEANENVAQCARREVFEESSVKASNLDFEGLIIFKFLNNGNIHHVHVFSAESWEGTPEETEEMRPKWFPHSEIPYSNMWPDDIYWFPFLLKKQKFFGNVEFSDENKMEKYEFKEISANELLRKQEEIVERELN